MQFADLAFGQGDEPGAGEAQGLPDAGGVFLVAASIFVVTNILLVAWVLAWIVAALAFLNFAFNICVGCIMYAQLVRIGLLPLSREPAR